jgi:hypothetical protein
LSGEPEVLSFKKILDCIYYYLDSTKATRLKIKIEHFKLNQTNKSVIVFYRLGRQKILNEMSLTKFSTEYFENISNYDQHRLTKFSTLQHILNTLFLDEHCSKENLYRFIEGQIKNEQLF